MARKKELENVAQCAVDQAQQQIAELLKQKDTFTFFRRNRDEKINKDVTTIEQHIEKIKEKLASDIEECEQEAQRKIKELKKYAIHRAEQICATEDLEKIIK